MSKTDITIHADNELSDIFQNEEWLYWMIHRTTTTQNAIDLASELFRYNKEQLDIFVDDFESGIFG